MALKPAAKSSTKPVERPKSTTQKASAVYQAEMKKNALLQPPKPTGDRAADKKAADQFLIDSRKQTAERAAADLAAAVKQQQLDYTRANPLQGTRPATTAARAQVAASRGSPDLTNNLQQVGDPMKRVSQAYQTPAQKDNLQRMQAEATARLIANPKPVYTGPQGKPTPKPGQQTPGQIANYKKIIDQQSGATGIPKAVAAPLPPDLASTLPTNPSTGLPVGVQVGFGEGEFYNQYGIPGTMLPPQPRTDGYQPTSSTPISGDFNLAAYENNQKLPQFQPGYVPPSLATLQPGQVTASMTPQDMYSQYANNIMGAPSTTYNPTAATSLATLQPGAMTASTPAIQNTIAPGYQTATPGATGIYAQPDAAGQLAQSGQGGIYGQPGQPGTYLSGTAQYPIGAGPLGASSGTFSGYQPGQPFMTNGFQPMSTGNQPYSLGQTYGQTQGTGMQAMPGIDPTFNTNSQTGATGQLPQNAPNFGQQQQNTQQANPIKIQVENPTPDATVGSGSGKFGGSGSPMGTINTSAL
jgi:hypothetical protein